MCHALLLPLLLAPAPATSTPTPGSLRPGRVAGSPSPLALPGPRAHLLQALRVSWSRRCEFPGVLGARLGPPRLLLLLLSSRLLPGARCLRSPLRAAPTAAPHRCPPCLSLAITLAATPALSPGASACSRAPHPPLLLLLLRCCRNGSCCCGPGPRLRCCCCGGRQGCGSCLCLRVWARAPASPLPWTLSWPSPSAWSARRMDPEAGEGQKRRGV